MIRLHVAAVVVAFALAGCQSGKDAPPPAVAQADTGAAALGPGEAMLDVPGGQIWYRRTGTTGGAPVILLHGGPGFSSFYMKSLEGLASDRPVIRYDQLGGGRSNRISDTTLFTIDHFVRELDSLRSALGYGKVHLVGHSWGTILGLEYYRAHPDHVLSLTLASPAIDIPTWEKNTRRLLKTLSDSSQRAIAAGEAEKKFDTPAYQHALEEFYGRYVWLHPVEADLDSTFQTVNEGIYVYMLGPSEFTITGTLRTYDATPFLRQVKVPTLYTVGEFDEADPATVRRFAAMTPGAMVEVIPGAAHITTWDNPEAMLKVVRDFLASVDTARGGGS